MRVLVKWVATNGEVDAEASAALLDVLDTPVSPELLPPDENGKINQKTEDLVGPYELHDFFLYQIIRFGYHPAKILFLAEKAFAGEYDRATLLKWLKNFYRRFFIQQFSVLVCPMARRSGHCACLPEATGECLPMQSAAFGWTRSKSCNVIQKKLRDLLQTPHLLDSILFHRWGVFLSQKS